MKFLIQYNLMDEGQLQKVKNAVTSYPHMFVGLVPFSRKLESNEPIEGSDYIPYGSTLLCSAFPDFGWKGLHFDLNQMNYMKALQNRNDMLNDGVMSIMAAAEFLETKGHEHFFVRPSADLKQFSGTTMAASRIAEWFRSMMECPDNGGTYYFPPDDEVVVSSVKEISAEWRWFIVDGKIVTGSLYRAHNQFRPNRELDKEVIDEAQAMADIWLPDDCVVMDTALYNGEMKVVEFNCINCSGFYDNDVQAVFDAMWKRHN